VTARWVACIGVVLGLGLAPAGSTARVPETPAVAATPSEQGGVARSARSQPGIFVRTLTVYGGRLWVGTFNEGLLVVDAWSPPEGLERARPLAAPFRMVNDVLEVNGSLYVAANEGLFVTSDGATFARVPQVGGRSVTSMAFDGRSLYATGSDKEAARLAGISASRVTCWTFVLMGLLSGAAAALNAVRFREVQSSAGVGLELKTIAAVVVGGASIAGGRGTLFGTLIGVLLLGCIGPALTYAGVNAYWEKAIQGVIILAAVVADAAGKARSGGAAR